MPDRSDEYWDAAAECISLARAITDPVTRIKLLMLAQKWQHLALGSGINFDAILKDFNDRQMDGH